MKCTQNQLMDISKRITRKGIALKKLVLIIIVLIIVLGTVIVIFKINKKTNIMDLQDNKILKTEIENIVSIRMKEATEGGYLYYETKDSKTIEKIYNALKNIKVGGQIDINVVDNCRDYIFNLEDGTEKIFSFQSNFYYKDYNTYETENYKELKKIEIPMVESWE